MQGFPLIFAGLIGTKGRRIAGRSGLSEHQCQLRHPLAMSAGVRTFRIDGTGQQLNESIQQLFLPRLQSLTLDAHRCRAGNSLQESDAVGPQFFQVSDGAAVVDQQNQQADGFVMAIVQADADQMNAWRLHCQQHSLQIPGLIETEMADDIVGADQSLEPLGAVAVLQVVALYLESFQCLRRAVDDQSIRLHARAVAFAQVDQPGLRLGNLHRFKQHPLQQRGEARFGAKGVGDTEETRQSVFHACHRHAQLIDFKYR